MDASAQGLEATEGKAGEALRCGMVLGKSELTAHGIKDSEQSNTPAAKLDQSPLEICTLPAEETGRGDALGCRGFG